MPSPYNTYGGAEDYRSEYQPRGSRSTGSGTTGLAGILNTDFRPEFDRLQGEQPDLEKSLTDLIASPIDFEAFRSEIDAFAQSAAGDLFNPGGKVEQATRGAAGQAVESGFGVSSGGFDAARMNIFGEARDSLTNSIAGKSTEIAGIATQKRASDVGNLAGFVEGQALRLDDLRESLFTGDVTIEQLKLAQEQMEQNRRIIDEALKDGGGLGLSGSGLLAGAAVGAEVGSMFPGPGTAIGAGVGGLIGLFS